jgi:hypothetical protein
VAHGTWGNLPRQAALSALWRWRHSGAVDAEVDQLPIALVLRRVMRVLRPMTHDIFNLRTIFSARELRDWVLGMGRSFGDKSCFGEDQTQCDSCKQCDIFLLGPQFCRSGIKFSAWMRTRDQDEGQIGGRLEDRRVRKLTQVTHAI